MHVLAYTLQNVNLKCILIEYDKGMVSLKYLLVWNSRIIRRVTKEFWVTSLAFGVYLLYFCKLFLMGCVVVCQLYFCRFLYTWRPRMCRVKPLPSITTCDNFFFLFFQERNNKNWGIEKSRTAIWGSILFSEMPTNVGIFFLKRPKNIKGKIALGKLTCSYTEYIGAGLYVEGKDQGAILVWGRSQVWDPNSQNQPIWVPYMV